VETSQHQSLGLWPRHTAIAVAYPRRDARFEDCTVFVAQLGNFCVKRTYVIWYDDRRYFDICLRLRCDTRHDDHQPPALRNNSHAVLANQAGHGGSENLWLSDWAKSLRVSTRQPTDLLAGIRQPARQLGRFAFVGT
jgi:hypothetical protein